MSTPEDRDPFSDRLLKRSLTPTDAVAAGPCLDAETLAAWADGAISGAKAEAIERHLSDCARCQAMLAAFATADLADAAPVMSGAPAAQAQVVPFRAKVTNRWVPLALGAIAASLLIYTAWPARRTSDATRQEQTTAQAAPTGAQAPAPADLQFQQARTATPTSTPAPADRKAASAKLTKSLTQPAAAPKPAPEPLPAANPTPAPPAAAGAATATGTVSLAAPPPPAVVASPPARPEVIMLRGVEEATLRTADASRVVAEFTSPATTALGVGQSLIGARAGGGAGGAGGGGRGALATTPRPTARVNWRVLASGAVERSTNGGQTWTPVTITPATAIVGGAAPSEKVCWLIGRAGIVLVSTDGIVFRRVRAPDVADLRSITAIDEFQATVTTVGSRVFKTEDGGETWKEGW